LYGNRPYADFLAENSPSRQTAWRYPHPERQFQVFLPSGNLSASQPAPDFGYQPGDQASEQVNPDCISAVSMGLVVDFSLFPINHKGGI
jgi:hypothetical protein